MCDLHHKKCMHEGREKEKENSFTDILFSTYRQGGGKQWNEFPLLFSHLFMEQYSSVRIRGEIILQPHEPKPHESFPDLHLGQHSFMLL